MNLGFLGKGNASRPEALRQQVDAGAIGSSCMKTGARRHRPSTAA